MNYLDFLAPYAAGAVHAILLVSWFLVPMLLLEVVVPGQKLNALTVAFNLLWAPLYLIFAALLLHHVSAVVRPAIPINIFGLQIQDAPPWKLALIVFVYLVLFDLLFYWFHRAQHKWQWMWRFHRFHHSDNNVALLSATRHHWVEESIRFFMIFIPLIILFGNHLQALPWLGIAIGVSGMFIHWNSPLRLGVLTSLVVGPQYHRIHHSVNPEHHDKNFSVMFPFWDRVFGTQYLPKPGEFPRTGLGPDQPNVLLQLSPWPMLQRRRPGMAGRPD